MMSVQKLAKEVGVAIWYGCYCIKGTEGVFTFIVLKYFLLE